MKTYIDEHKTMNIKAYEENGKYYLVINKSIKFLAGTRSGKTVVEETVNTFKKEFATAKQANNYFKAIKKSNPTLKSM